MRGHFKYCDSLAIILTGNPGVGKHTIMNELTEKRRLKIIDVNSIAKENSLYEKSGNTNDVDVRKLKKIISKEITRDSLLVGHLAPYVVSRNQISLAIVMRRSPYELVKVYRKRGYEKIKIIENAASEILGIIAYDTIKKIGKKKTIQIDCTNRSIKQTKDMVLDTIEGKRINDHVDWLSLVLEKDHLEKFFPSN